MNHDIEAIRNSLVKVVKDNLETKINEIVVEKNDGVSMKTPSLDNMVQSMGDAVVNQQLFLRYGVVDIETVDSGVAGTASYTLVMFFMVAFMRDQNEKADPEVKALRYSRALQEVFLDNATKLRGGKIAVKPYAPIDWSDNSGSPYWKVGGVEVEFTAAI